jgi:hypothetical protein
MALVQGDRSWPPGREGEEALRVSQWAEIRQIHLVERVPLRENSRRLDLDVKTIRHAARHAARHAEAKLHQRSPPRGRRLDA